MFKHLLILSSQLRNSIQLVVRNKNSWNNFDVKARIIGDRKLIRIALIRTNLRSLWSSILRSFHAGNYLKNFCYGLLVLPLALYPLSMLAQETLNYGNPSRSFCSNSYGIEAAIDGLLLQPFEEGFSYAIRNDNRQSSGGVDGAPGGAVINFQSEWQPAFRFSLGYTPSFTLRALWMDFHAKSVNHAHADTALSGAGLEGIWMPAIDSQVLYGSAAFRWKLDLDLVDFELGKRYQVSSALTINPYCSMRFAWIDQSVHAIYSLPSNSAYARDQVMAMNDFHGIGPRLGLSSEWGFAHGWMILAGGSASLLYGRFNTHDGFSTAAASSAELLNDIDEHFSQMAPNADFNVGFGYGRSFSNSGWHFGVQIGYEAQVFWNQNEWRQPIGSDAPALAILQTLDLSIQGFSLRGQFEF